MILDEFVDLVVEATNLSLSLVALGHGLTQILLINKPLVMRNGNRFDGVALSKLGVGLCLGSTKSEVTGRDAHGESW